MVPHAPWLCAAPPWPTNPHITADRDPRTTTATPAAGAQRKRSAEHITDADATLGKLAHDMGRALELKGWHRLIDELRGQSDVTPTVRSIPHKAGRLLEHLRCRGASVPMATPPWDLDRKDAAILRGPISPHTANVSLSHRKCWIFAGRATGWWSRIVPCGTGHACESRR